MNHCHWGRFLNFLFILLVIDDSSSRLIALTPLKSIGRLSKNLPKGYAPAIFLGNEKGISVEDDILYDLVPIPILDPRGLALVECAISANAQPLSGDSLEYRSDVQTLILGRDKGIFDNLPFGWGPVRSTAKKDLFNFFGVSSRRDPSFGSPSPCATFAQGINEILGAKITSLFIEVQDELSPERLVLGAGAVLCRTPDEARQWTLSTSTSTLDVPPTLSTADDIIFRDSCVAYLHLDELVAFSLGLNIPIYIPKGLLSAAKMNARLKKIQRSKEGGGDDEGEDVENEDRPILVAPAFRSSKEEKEFSKNNVTVLLPSTSPSSTSSSLPPTRKAWEIYDVNEIMSMSSVEKRAVLRASGVKNIPRPREGIEALDQCLMSVLDDAVRASLLGILSKNNPRYLTEARASESPRQKLLQEMSIALQQGDTERAERLREEFASLTVQRADPTQRKGSYDPYLDQDDWYLEQRRRAMGGSKKKKE